MTYIHELTIDVASREALKVIRVKQSDTNRYIKVWMTAGGVPIVPSSGDSAVFRCKKPDCKSCYNTAEINSDGSISVRLTAQALAVPGETQADISVYQGDNILSTANFTILVEAMPFNGNTAQSSDEYQALADMVADADEILSEASGYADRAEAAAEQAEENYAHKEGDYPGLNSGNLTDTTYTENSDPYTYRKTPSSAGGTVNIERITGASAGYNQFAKDFSTASNWNMSNGTLTVANNVGSYTITTLGTRVYDNIIWNSFTVPANHRVLVTAEVKAKKTHPFWFFLINNSGNPSSARTVVANTWTKVSTMATSTTTPIVRLQCSFNTTADTGYAVGDVEQIRNVQCIDLTAMLGTTIADYIYSLEQEAAGSGVAYFEKYFGSGYHEYDTGSIKSVNTSGRRAVGKNLLTDKKFIGGHQIWFGFSGTPSPTNYTCSLPSGTYTFSFTATDGNQTNIYVLNVDTEEYAVRGGITTKHTFTLNKGGNYAIWVYKSSYASVDVIQAAQLEFGTTATDYEPYHGITYPVSQTDLRGIFKLTDGKLTADGDVYLPNGSVTRKYGIIDLGTNTWVKSGDAGLFLWYNPQTTDNMQLPSSNDIAVNAICSKYPTATYSSHPDKSCYASWTTASTKYFAILDSAYASTSAADFKTAMSGVYLVYELATPTTETLDSYSEEQYCSPYGTEEWVGSDIPVGHVTEYASNDGDKLKTLMGAAGADGTYIVAQENGVMRLEKLKTREIYYAPSSDLAANSYGVFTIANPDEIKNARVIIATSITSAYPTAAAGYQLTGRAGRGSNIYVSYYTPRAISAANTGFNITITYI